MPPDDHASDKSKEAVVAPTIGAAGRQELIEADVDHDAGDKTEEDAHHLRRDDPRRATHGQQQNGIGNQGAHHLSQTAEKGKDKGFPTIAGGVENGHRDANAFRNVVQCNGDSNGNTQTWVLQCGQKRDQALREIVNGDSQRREKPHPQQLIVLLALFGTGG